MLDVDAILEDLVAPLACSWENLVVAIFTLHIVVDNN